MDRSGRRPTGGDKMFNLARDWVAYVFIALFVGFWIYIIIKGRQTYEEESQDEGTGKEDRNSEKD